MPASTRDENFTLVASGPANYAPFLAGWQEFKDNLRKYVSEQPGWADVTQGPRKGEVQGWTRMERKSDAEAVYSAYIKHRGILVHLFKTSRSNADYRLMKCNCSTIFSDIPDRGHSPTRSGIPQSGMERYMSGYSSSPASPQYMVPAASPYAYSAYPQQHSVYMAPTYAVPAAPVQMVAPQIPMYTSAHGGMPVNLSSGAVFTEARGIFISNLSYKTGPNDLLALLSRVGRPVDYKMHKDPRTGHFKGSATATFSSKEEAQVAVAQLNQTTHMNMVINVRHDTERTPVGQVQAPVIVDGSHYPRVQYGIPL